ncbi:hypothetical protein N7519_007277 [Penicillium mononematosum]|uniref:uncharacterized protein n=1 Tax=Penicillium mononematosum TaxID=268346 RepID=UPI0025465EA4|nr:uncharacterized protein N7519_007277 [Penicillium mononematosum]KAJ6185976.1 hypothetical protein N7519_007277 [Penicillium mononematosum]
MANQQGPARRNGVIGFNMTGGPTPAIPLIAPRYKGPIPDPSRGNGPVGIRMPAAPPSSAPYLSLQYDFQKDRHDIQDLRQIVAAAEFNLQRQKRLAGAEDRFKGLAKNLDLMLAAAMQATRDSQLRARSAPTAESSIHPVCIARHHIVGSHLTILPQN